MIRHSGDSKADFLKSLEELIDSGQSDEATRRIDGILKNEKSNEQLYCDLVNILLLIPDYKRCTHIFEKYKSETGKELVADFSLEEIIAEENETPLDKEGGNKEYKRMSIWERGHFSNRFLLNPVLSIRITKKYLYIKRKYNKERSFLWRDLNVFICREKAYKGYGAGTGGNYTRSTLNIVAPDRKYRIDISSNFPDFKRSKKMIEEMKRFVDVAERNE